MLALFISRYTLLVNNTSLVLHLLRWLKSSIVLTGHLITGPRRSTMNSQVTASLLLAGAAIWLAGCGVQTPTCPKTVACPPGSASATVSDAGWGKEAAGQCSTPSNNSTEVSERCSVPPLSLDGGNTYSSLPSPIGGPYRIECNGVVRRATECGWTTPKCPSTVPTCETPPTEPVEERVRLECAAGGEPQLLPRPVDCRPGHYMTFAVDSSGQRWAVCPTQGGDSNISAACR